MAGAIEPWADARLRATNDLELWLDASKENAARTEELASSQNPMQSQFKSGGPLDCWHDASGHKRNVTQPIANARPRFLQTTLGATVRFDGTNDFLISSGLGKRFDETTIFIVTAPHSNKGEFGSFLALSHTGANDYSEGLNIDMGPGAKDKFDFVNVEGSGFTGINNLMTSPVAFGETRVLSLCADAGTNTAFLWIDGVPQEKYGHPTPERKAKRNRKSQVQDPSFAFNQITVGARFFSNTAEPPHVQGFFDGDILEVLIYSRVLESSERAEVERYLKSKLVSKFPGRTLAPLVGLTNPPPVQMFMPGFTVRELPVTLNNINCLKYREDGKLVALGYDGNIWLLSDTDGDGVEDKVTAFWNKASLRSPIGMALTPPNYPKGRGVFVPSKGKLSLIVDTNADDVADEEIIVAKGWNELPHGVDALGVAVDKDNSIYFGLGTVNFASAYLIENGKSHYDLKNEHGTIMKVAPDFSKREIVCTGIRFPVALAFNGSGDLFCTDQEGATWLPNGNPLDELLHIERERHYGFPPRHPKHLPNVIDEPSVFDYSPQHQSTCGLNFNLPVNGGPTFGPASWKGDAFVVGYSRGKLYRTQLAKSVAGYVAQNQLIGSTDMLPEDVCISPQGDMVICVHSGKPDWGSGPTGVGKLYKISYREKEAEQPVSIWAASSTETQIEFDRPLDPAKAKEISKGITISQGRFVAAGDPYEILRPGYQAVQNQLLEPRYALKVLSTAWGNEGRTLIIRTDRRNEAVSYAVTLSRTNGSATAKDLPQGSTIDLAYDLTGAEVEWQNTDGKEKWSGWLPHLDLAVARAFTAGSGAHEQFWKKASGLGKLKLRTQLDLWQMLRPAVQPGSKLDFEYTKEAVTVVLKSTSPLEVTASSMKLERVGENEVHLTATPQKDVWFPIEVALQNASKAAPALDISWFTAEDSRPRALPRRRILLPWSTPEQITGEPITEHTIPEIAGGNWLRGKKMFFGEKAACSRCHTMNGEGGKIGPELSNLLHRDYASVLKDIMEPSAAINPDHIAYNVQLKDGEMVSGILVGSSETESKFADVSGKITTIKKSQVASMKPSTISLMPEGLLEAFSEAQRKDLLTFLLTQPLLPAPIGIAGEPPPRQRAELDAILKQKNPLSSVFKDPMRIVLCSGPKDHGPDEHDYPLWQKRWTTLLGLADKVVVEATDKWPSPEQFSAANVIVFYSNNPDWTPAKAKELDAFLNRGGGAVYLHYAVDGHDHCDDLAQRIGLAWRGGQSKFRHGPLDLKFNPHPLAAGLSGAHFVDESYWNLVGSPTNIQLLASGVEENQAQPLMWTHEQGKGRVFVSIPGHYTWTFDDPLFRLLILRGVAWSAQQPLNRFDDLVTIGARIAEK
ncbi:MAG: hypothetical protein JWM68_5562 [Verrucomicrobiales bacterium]|nr:hypothetical protein [Verrucomicrobiales bacterium]